jgi:3-oxoacyl-[acyl-carrier-protein] synthase-1
MASITRPSIRIIGIGARTPVGLSAPAAAAAVRAGVAVMADHPFMIDKAGAPMVVCIDPALPVELGLADRILELAISSAREALKPVLERVRKLPRIRIILALPEDRPGKPDRLANTFTERFISALGIDIPVLDLTCHSLGHAGGLYCMEQALSFINGGQVELCLVGGVDSYLDPEALEWLDETDQLHSESTTWGFCPSEGAAFCLLASREFADAPGPSTSVELLAAASATEPNRIHTETICIGEGLSEAFTKALTSLPLNQQVNHTICDMTGEPYRGNEYGFAMLRSARKFADDADFQTPVDCWGNVGAASGPLFTMLATSAAKKRYSPGPLTLLWASSEGGLRAAALLEARG